MLNPYLPPVFSEADQQLFEALVFRDHHLQCASAHIDSLQLRDVVAPLCSPDVGRPAEEPVLMLKFEFLQYHDNLSDRQVIARAQTDVAYRWFLGLGRNDNLPDPSRLSARLTHLTEILEWTSELPVPTP